MRTLLAGLLAFSLGGLALAQDDKKPEEKKPESRADRLKAIQKETQPAMMAAQKEAQKKLADVTSEKDRKAVIDEYNKTMTEVRTKAADKALELAKEDTKDAAGLDALLFAVQMGGKAKDWSPVAWTALEHHAASPKIRPMIDMVARSATGDKDALAFVEEVIEKAPSKELKASALLGLGQAYKSKALPYSGPDPKDFAESVKKAEEYLGRVEKEYGDLTLRGKQTFGAAAKSALAGLKNAPNLRIGKTIPDIEGEDTDGQQFKLSDYRGKVVVLDFWGHW